MEWLILGVDVVAMYIVIQFLRKKVKRKLDEVEARQKHALHQRRSTAQTHEEEHNED
jgi:hypothetical protein